MNQLRVAPFQKSTVARGQWWTWDGTQKARAFYQNGNLVLRLNVLFLRSSTVASVHRIPPPPRLVWAPIVILRGG
ncbi:hypothetical protein N8766_02650 [bacterium]|nr:hypothetical protein [bacterium]